MRAAPRASSDRRVRAKIADAWAWVSALDARLWGATPLTHSHCMRPGESKDSIVVSLRNLIGALEHADPTTAHSLVSALWSDCQELLRPWPEPTSVSRRADSLHIDSEQLRALQRALEAASDQIRAGHCSVAADALKDQSAIWEK